MLASEQYNRKDLSNIRQLLFIVLSYVLGNHDIEICILAPAKDMIKPDVVNPTVWAQCGVHSTLNLFGGLLGCSDVASSSELKQNTSSN